ncbi:hypothetical protein BT96DRAFT_1001111 [Gymnopus androsaceus JB14]|uniref:Uncharacterized protein n=1 Tax=Gymnopus androsaceus JB14 TaxID=1447944 RepID=A0A6A4H390_9AGAR|nr:hypothetical protein BT96DRAFT_1001111 [Gymnopus androsaceus JB14]
MNAIASDSFHHSHSPSPSHCSYDSVESFYSQSFGDNSDISSEHSSYSLVDSDSDQSSPNFPSSSPHLSSYSDYSQPCSEYYSEFSDVPDVLDGNDSYGGEDFGSSASSVHSNASYGGDDYTSVGLNSPVSLTSSPTPPSACAPTSAAVLTDTFDDDPWGFLPGLSYPYYSPPNAQTYVQPSNFATYSISQPSYTFPDPSYCFSNSCTAYSAHVQPPSYSIPYSSQSQFIPISTTVNYPTSFTYPVQPSKHLVKSVQFSPSTQVILYSAPTPYYSVPELVAHSSPNFYSMLLAPPDPPPSYNPAYVNSLHYSSKLLPICSTNWANCPPSRPPNPLCFLDHHTPVH